MFLLLFRAYYKDLSSFDHFFPYSEFFFSLVVQEAHKDPQRRFTKNQKKMEKPKQVICTYCKLATGTNPKHKCPASPSVFTWKSIGVWYQWMSGEETELPLELVQYISVVTHDLFCMYFISFTLLPSSFIFHPRSS